MLFAEVACIITIPAAALNIDDAVSGALCYRQWVLLM